MSRDLNQLAEDLFHGKVFTDRHVRDNAHVHLVFIPLALASQEQLDKLREDGVFVIYEYLDKAGGRSVNGYPTFLSFQTLTKDEWIKVLTTHDRMKAAVEAVKA